MGFHMAVSCNLPASFSVGLLLASFQTPSFVQLLQFPSYKGLQLEEIKKKQLQCFMCDQFRWLKGKDCTKTRRLSTVCSLPSLLRPGGQKDLFHFCFVSQPWNNPSPGVSAAVCWVFLVCVVFTQAPRRCLFCSSTTSRYNPRTAWITSSSRGGEGQTIPSPQPLRTNWLPQSVA